MELVEGTVNKAFHTEEDNGVVGVAYRGHGRRQDVGKDAETEADHDNYKRLAERSSTVTLPEVTVETESPLLYKIGDSPPFGLTVFLGFQQACLTITGSLVVPLLVADAVCARDRDEVIRKLLSSTMFMNGFTTLFQTVLGIRLPVFQGPTSSYIVPLLALNEMDPSRCNISRIYPLDFNSSNNSIGESQLRDELVDLRIRELMGPLMLAGVLHCLVGLTGLVGYLLRFIGPVTIVPTILLIGIYIVKPTMTYVESHWGITFFTWATGLILSLYLGHRRMPIPAYSKQSGFHIFWYPLHQVFALLIAILLSWALCGILTSAGVFTDDKSSPEYKARTDARSDVIAKTDWFYFPYPGQFGTPLFGISAMIGCLIATLTSILDSIGDYYATASMCRVPPPPNHGVNRGIAVEGFCSFLSGIVGCGHATTTYGGNIGAIGMTRVASRQVFYVTSVIYMVFAVVAKISAVFISIPYPVLGGCLVVTVSVFVGVNLSNLQVINLASTRNLSIIGGGIFVGLLVPDWLTKNRDAIQTGNADVDQILTILLVNPNFLGGALACFLDNTVPGTDEERGIAAWKNPEKVSQENNQNKYLEGFEVYEPLLPSCVKSFRLMKYFPIFPDYEQEEEEIFENKPTEAAKDKNRL